MKINFFCTFLLYLVIFRGDCNAEYNINEQLQVSANILQVYNRDLDNSIKWKQLKIINLDVEVEYHTNETISRMEKIRGLLNGAADSYFVSSHEMYDWASDVISKLTAFERLKSQDVIIGKLIVDISQLGKEKAEKSIEKLMMVRQKFTNASLECKNIIPYFNIDKLNESERFIKKRLEVRISGHLGSFGVSAFLGAIGLILGSIILPGIGTLAGGAIALGSGQAVGSTVTELVFVQNVEKELDRVKNYFEKLYPRIGQAAGLIDDVVKGVQEEISRVTDLKNEAGTAITVVEAKLQSNKHLVDGDVKKLLDQCNEYKLVHSS